MAFKKISLGNRSMRTLKSAEACITWIRLPVRKISSVCSLKVYCCTPVEMILCPCVYKYGRLSDRPADFWSVK